MSERMGLMGEIAALLHEPGCPVDVRAAGLDLIASLATREAGEAPCQRGLDEMRARVLARRAG